MCVLGAVSLGFTGPAPFVPTSSRLLQSGHGTQRRCQDGRAELLIMTASVASTAYIDICSHTLHQNVMGAPRAVGDPLTAFLNKWDEAGAATGESFSIVSFPLYI